MEDDLSMSSSTQQRTWLSDLNMSPREAEAEDFASSWDLSAIFGSSYELPYELEDHLHAVHIALKDAQHNHGLGSESDQGRDNNVSLENLGPSGTACFNNAWEETVSAQSYFCVVPAMDNETTYPLLDFDRGPEQILAVAVGEQTDQSKQITGHLHLDFGLAPVKSSLLAVGYQEQESQGMSYPPKDFEMVSPDEQSSRFPETSKHNWKLNLDDIHKHIVAFSAASDSPVTIDHSPTDSDKGDGFLDQEYFNDLPPLQTLPDSPPGPSRKLGKVPGAPLDFQEIKMLAGPNSKSPVLAMEEVLQPWSSTDSWIAEWLALKPCIPGLRVSSPQYNGVGPVILSENVADGPKLIPKKKGKSSQRNPADERRRACHIAQERNRRQNMRKQLTLLKRLIPYYYLSTKRDQASILDCTIRYIKDLERTLEELYVALRRHATGETLKRSRSQQHQGPFAIDPSGTQVDHTIQAKGSSSSPQLFVPQQWGQNTIHASGAPPLLSGPPPQDNYAFFERRAVLKSKSWMWK